MEDPKAQWQPGVPVASLDEALKKVEELEVQLIAHVEGQIDSLKSLVSLHAGMQGGPEHG